MRTDSRDIVRGVEPLVNGASLLDGRYVVGKRIGRGSNGTVYEGRLLPDGRAVAIKVFESGDDAARERFEREMEVHTQLRHEAVIQVLDVGRTPGGAPFIVMELIERGTLAQRLEQDGALPPEDVVVLGLRMASALQAAHALGVVHGDVAPSNIFLPGGDLAQAKLGDFGYVESLQAHTGTTQAGTIVDAAKHLVHRAGGDEPQNLGVLTLQRATASSGCGCMSGRHTPLSPAPREGCLARGGNLGGTLTGGTLGRKPWWNVDLTWSVLQWA